MVDMMRLCGISLVCLFMIVNKVYAREFTVGGAKGWAVPSGSQVYNQWAEQSRFQIGDSLLFVYQPSQDSVLQVTRDAYDSCNTDAPIAKFTDGKTSFALTNSGPYYFISGNKDHCNKNEKLVVIVMADRSGKNNNTTPLSPPSPAPAPSEEYAPSPPFTGTLGTPAPTPTPSEDNPNNSASSSSSSFFVISVLGAALASTLFLH